MNPKSYDWWKPIKNHPFNSQEQKPQKKDKIVQLHELVTGNKVVYWEVIHKNRIIVHYKSESIIMHNWDDVEGWTPDI